MTSEEIESLMPWGPPAIAPTKFGERIRRDARLTLDAAQPFISREEELRKHGITLRMSKSKLYYVATLWRAMDAKVAAHRAESLELSSASDADIEIPCRPGLAYRGYQRAGAKYIIEKFKAGFGVLLADEMGVGKTVQAIMVINADPKINRVLIVPPAKLKGNWFGELSRWLTRDLSVGIVDSKCFPSTDIVICNFEMVSKFSKSLAFYWDLIVIDEAHKCSNAKTQRARAIFGYRSKKPGESQSAIPTRRKLALTGTPIPNKVMEIFPILHWLNPEEWADSFKFGFRYCNAKRTRFGWDFSGASNLEELSDRLRRSIMCRRLKSEVMTELPPKTRLLIELESDVPTSEQAEWAEMLKRTKRKNVEADFVESGDAFTDQASLMEDDLKIAFNEMAEFRHKSALAKLKPFIEDVHERMEEIEKVVIFGHHKDCMARLMMAFAQYNPVQIVGDTKDPMRAQWEFQNVKACRMILGSDSMMEGFTLTASSTVMFFDGDWVPGKLTQKEDRLHRIGQRDNVLCYYYVLRNSLDARMIKRALAKQEIIDQALDKK